MRSFGMMAALSMAIAFGGAVPGCARTQPTPWYAHQPANEIERTLFDGTSRSVIPGYRQKLVRILNDIYLEKLSVSDVISYLEDNGSQCNSSEEYELNCTYSFQVYEAAREPYALYPSTFYYREYVIAIQGETISGRMSLTIELEFQENEISREEYIYGNSH